MPIGAQPGSSMRSGVPAIVLCVLSATVVAAQNQDITVYSVGNGVSPPTVVRRVAATYTPEAKAVGIVGWVVLAVVVDADGTVREVRIAESCLGRTGVRRQANGDPFRCKSADEYEVVNGEHRAKGVDTSLGLDQQAVDTVRQSIFKPGMKEDKAVAVRFMIRQTFHPSQSDVPR